jgi:hypothetical protein
MRTPTFGMMGPVAVFLTSYRDLKACGLGMVGAELGVGVAGVGVSAPASFLGGGFWRFTSAATPKIKTCAPQAGT